MKNFEKYKPYSIRLKHYNYSWPGEYFITICTKDRINYFGEIGKDQKMVLPEIGRLVEKELLNTEKLCKEIKIDIYAVMPNHVHAIVTIDPIVETQGLASLRETDGFQNKFGPQSKNLGSMVRGFKSAVKKYATINNIDFAWQSGYHEEIISTESHYDKVYDYILSNPSKWEEDRNNPKNIEKK